MIRAVTLQLLTFSSDWESVAETPDPKRTRVAVFNSGSNVLLLALDVAGSYIIAALDPGTYFAEDFGTNVDVYAKAQTGSTTVTVAEYAS